MDLTVFPNRSELRNEHAFPPQPAAAPLGNQGPGSEPLAIASSTERCDRARGPLLLDCGPVSIVTSRRSNLESSTYNQSLE
jgi:hypothetical protein